MEAILSRRSVRKYTSEPVSEDAVKELLRAAMSAPSAGNERPWHFVVIRDRKTMGEIQKFHPFARMLDEAPVAILVCGDQNLEKHGGFWVQDCSAATENILIAAQSMGLGAVWLGLYPIRERVEGIQRLVGIPENVTPLSLVSIGHPAEKRAASDRYDESRVHKETWEA
ncbi:MAG: nitroreductase family protein [Methanomassiliicoccales archaeon]|jgi:nitroreductase